MGDTVPDKRVEHKLDTFLSEFKTDSGFQKTDHHNTIEGDKNPGLFEEIKASTQNFMDFERENMPQDFAYSTRGISVTGDKLDDFGVKSVLTDPIISHKIKDKEGESELHKDLSGSFSPSKVAPHLDEPLKPSAPASFEENEKSKTVTQEKEKSKIIIEEKPKLIETEVEKSIRELKKSVEDVKVIDQKKSELTKKTNEKQEEKTKETKPVSEKQRLEKQLDNKTKLEAEALFCNLGLDAWFRPNQLNPRVESLIYWRDPKKSGPVFAGVLIVLLALTYFSLISVVAYLSLLILTGTISFRIYKNIVQAVQKTGDGHPFKEILEAEVGLPQDKTKEVSEVIVANLNGVLHELRRLFLVEDLVDSIKFAVFLWCMTYLGAWFNGMTLVIISWVALFTLPKVYEMNKTQIDNNLQLVKSKLAEFTSKVKAAIPIGKKEEKKDQ
ncbi:reticulon-1 isoform X3 [Agrilus planipennis]|nr:reticulon-1 isoform X3 [Agrilus planipennis]